MLHVLTFFRTWKDSQIWCLTPTQECSRHLNSNAERPTVSSTPPWRHQGRVLPEVTSHATQTARVLDPSNRSAPASEVRKRRQRRKRGWNAWRHAVCDVSYDVIMTCLFLFFSLSSGDDHHLDRGKDIEKLLMTSHAEKLRLLEQQVRNYFKIFFHCLPYMYSNT